MLDVLRDYMYIKCCAAILLKYFLGFLALHEKELEIL